MVWKGLLVDQIVCFTFISDKLFKLAVFSKRTVLWYFVLEASVSSIYNTIASSDVSI